MRVSIVCVVLAIALSGCDESDRSVAFEVLQTVESEIVTAAIEGDNGAPREELLARYRNALINVDLVGQDAAVGIEDVEKRCRRMKDSVAALGENMRTLRAGQAMCADLALDLCARLEVQANILSDQTARNVSGTTVDTVGACIKMIRDLRQQCIWQYVDLPKSLYDRCYGKMTGMDRERMFEKSRRVIGREPKAF